MGSAGEPGGALAHPSGFARLKNFALSGRFSYEVYELLGRRDADRSDGVHE